MINSYIGALKRPFVLLALCGFSIIAQAEVTPVIEVNILQDVDFGDVVIGETDSDEMAFSITTNGINADIIYTIDVSPSCSDIFEVSHDGETGLRIQRVVNNVNHVDVGVVVDLVNTSSKPQDSYTCFIDLSADFN